MTASRLLGGAQADVHAWVVDYDLPADYHRKRFYRAVGRYLANHNLPKTGWSTWSVTFTEDGDFARFLVAEARAAGGTAHLWWAERVQA